MSDVTAKPWRENGRFHHKIVDRQTSETFEMVTLDCGHRFRVALPNPSEKIRCRYCIREEITGYNPPGDPTPGKVSQSVH